MLQKPITIFAAWPTFPHWGEGGPLSLRQKKGHALPAPLGSHAAETPGVGICGQLLPLFPPKGSLPSSLDFGSGFACAPPAAEAPGQVSAGSFQCVPPGGGPSLSQVCLVFSVRLCLPESAAVTVVTGETVQQHHQHKQPPPHRDPQPGARRRLRRKK